MANHHRGEVELDVGGRTLTLCLTLGALAELEEAFGVEDLAALGQRLSQGRLSSRDLLRILSVAARGGKTPLDDSDIAAMPLAGGLVPLVDAVARLFEGAFGSGPENPARP